MLGLGLQYIYSSQHLQVILALKIVKKTLKKWEMSGNKSFSWKKRNKKYSLRSQLCVFKYSDISIPIL